MAIRTVIGNVAADPEVKAAGKAQVTKLRVIENTGEYHNGEWVADKTPTTHYVEAWFELGTSVAQSVKKGQEIIVVGRESTWTSSDGSKTGRSIKADHIGPNLRTQVAQVTKAVRPDA